jgi:Fe-Mn family superoxide dismutase
MDANTMNIHYNKHYITYINNLNDEFSKNNYPSIPIEELISNIDMFSKNVRNNAGGYYNHSLFWLMLHPKSRKDNNLPFGYSKKIIERDFVSLDVFKNIIEENAKKRFGSGWVWWVLLPNGNTRIIETPYQDNPKMYFNCEILLGIDVWEHAYYLKYNADRMAYVKNIFNVINWNYSNSVLERYYSKF